MTKMDSLVDRFIEIAVAEDTGDGDHSSLSCIPRQQVGAASLIVKEDAVIAGIGAAIRVFHKIDERIGVKVKITDGETVKKGDIAFIVEGPVHSILRSERLVLNILQRMSGIATQTRKYADRLAGLKTKVLDTRKTSPGMRFLEKEAVRLGGGENHRMGLYDMIMLKDNHIDFAGGIKNAISRAIEYLDETGKDLPVEIETRGLDDVRQVLEKGGVQRIMFDNFTVDMTSDAVKMVDGSVETESSGGITLENIRSYAECGVDYVSVGALTHQVKGVDLSLKAFF